MTRNLKANLPRLHSKLHRVLSFLLLTFIVYGTLAAAAHMHGNPSDPTQPSHTAAVSEPGTKTTGGSI